MNEEEINCINDASNISGEPIFKMFLFFCFSIAYLIQRYLLINDSVNLDFMIFQKPLFKLKTKIHHFPKTV